MVSEGLLVRAVRGPSRGPWPLRTAGGGPLSCLGLGPVPALKVRSGHSPGRHSVLLTATLSVSFQWRRAALSGGFTCAGTELTLAVWTGVFPGAGAGVGGGPARRAAPPPWWI